MQQAMQTVRQTFGRVCVQEGLSEEIVNVHQPCIKTVCVCFKGFLKCKLPDTFHNVCHNVCASVKVSSKN